MEEPNLNAVFSNNRSNSTVQYYSATWCNKNQKHEMESMVTKQEFKLWLCVLSDYYICTTVVLYEYYDDGIEDRGQVPASKSIQEGGISEYNIFFERCSFVT